LLENRFATAELYGKLANIDADLSKEALKNTGTLKKMTGGDYIPAEEKFPPAFKFVMLNCFFPLMRSHSILCSNMAFDW
jgi:phage/plasmid-associated DNA primase